MLLQTLVSHCQNILAKQPSNRLLAIDVFRGLTITAMILVNNPGSWQHIYSPMRHAEWHGWTLTDLIFPFFIFIVGMSIQLSGQRLVANGIARGKIIQQALLRSFKLLLLGWFLALFYFNFGVEDYNWIDQRLMNMRFMGVLQRIALVYFVCVLLWLFVTKRALLLSFIGILLVYWLGLIHIPYEDSQGNQYLGLLDFGNNLSAWFDAWLFAPSHLYYSNANPFPFDPEGILSTLPAVASGISGMLVGHLLTQANLSERNKTYALVTLGIIGVVLGEIWHLYFPINKALWTSSYVLLSSGYACLVLAFLLFALKYKRTQLCSAPFVVFGANSIAFFMFAGVLARILIIWPVGDTSVKGWLYSHLFNPWYGPLNGSLFYALCFLVVSYMCMYWMYKKGIFWKV